MTNYTFYTTVFLPNMLLYIISLLILFAIYALLMKRVVRSIFDPLFIALLFSAFANSIPLFLFITKNIDTDKFVYIVLSEFIFWITYFCFRKKNSCFAPYVIKESCVSDSVYFVLLFMYISCHLITYAYFGIPLFKDSRLDTYTNSNGGGILAHLLNFSSFYCIVYSFYLYYDKTKYRYWGIFTFIVAFSFCFLSGSKGSILSIVTAFFFYKYFYKGSSLKIRPYLKYLPLILLFPICVIIMQSGTDFMQAVGSFFFRLLANGDVYWMGVSNNVIDDVKIHNEMIYLFSRILAPFRLIDYSIVDLPIGVQIDWMLLPGDEGILKGPNSRLPILGWVLFRWWGLILSFIFGFICAFWHTRLLHFFPKGIVSVIIFGFIYTNFAAMFTDPLLGTGYTFSITLFITILYFLYLFLGGRYIKYHSSL